MHLSRRQLMQGVGGVGLSAVLSACGHKLSSVRSSGSSLGSPTVSGPVSSTGLLSPQTPAVSSAPISSAVAPSLQQSTGNRAGLTSLSRSLSRPLVLPTMADYASAARLYNPRFDASHPVAIARCQSPADVSASVTYAAQARIPLHVRSGGHSYGGWSTGPGLVLDVGPLASVLVDPGSQTARIGAGANLITVYSAVAAKGLALAGGSCPTVGLTGLALGGGIGVLSRAYGLTCDAIRSVQIVTADGRLREVTARTDGDLFWALNGGGGGSFGVVTAFTMALRPAPQMHTFFLQWPFEEAQTVLTAWQRWISAADDRLWSTCKLLIDPPLGTRQLTVSGTWIGPAAELATQLAPLRAAVQRSRITDQASTLSYLQAMFTEAGCSQQSSAQCLASALSPAKRLPFAATSAILNTELPAAGIAALARAVQDGTGIAQLVEGGVSFDSMGGQISAVPVSGSAFVHRGALATLQYTATWASMATAPAAFDAYVAHLRATLLPWTGESAYVNYADPAIPNFASAYWGGNYPQLQAVKKHYDPGNLFSFAQSVRG